MDFVPQVAGSCDEKPPFCLPGDPMELVTGAASPEAEHATLKVRQHCGLYGPDSFKAVRAIIITFALLGILSVVLVLYPCLPAVLLMGGSLVRAFILFHDAAHGSLLESRSANQSVATLVSPWIARTAAGWSASHNHHHKVLGSDPPPANFPLQVISGRGCGYDDSRTVLFSKQEFDSWPLSKRLWVRVFRDPFVFFGLVVPAQWIYRPDEWPETLKWIAINVAFYVLGGRASWLSFLASTWVALVIAGILFHLQHQVNPGYWVSDADGHEHAEACLRGSSFLHVPWFLKWVTLGIEYHHLHHLSVRVPCYELQRCHETCPEAWLDGVVHVPVAKAFRSCFHAMWDEEAKMYVSFDVYRWIGLEDAQ